MLRLMDSSGDASQVLVAYVSSSGRLFLEESTPRVDPLFADSITNMRAGTKAERDATAVFGDFIMEKCDSGGRADVLKMLLSACVPVKRS